MVTFKTRPRVRIQSHPLLVQGPDLVTLYSRPKVIISPHAIFAQEPALRHTGLSPQIPNSITSDFCIRACISLTWTRAQGPEFHHLRISLKAPFFSTLASRSGARSPQHVALTQGPEFRQARLLLTGLNSDSLAHCSWARASAQATLAQEPNTSQPTPARRHDFYDT
jgi:hypothetical protein